MRSEFSVAAPGEIGTALPPTGQSIAAEIDDRQRLHDQVAIERGATSFAHRSEQGRAKWQHAVAIARRAFREQHDRLALRDALTDLGRDIRRGGAARAVDEHRALDAGHRPDARPLCHLRLGDEGDMMLRANDRNIEPGDMVGHDQNRVAGRGRLPFHPHPDTDNPAAGAVEGLCDAPGRQATPETRGHHLGGCQHSGDAGQRRQLDPSGCIQARHRNSIASADPPCTIKLQRHHERVGARSVWPRVVAASLADSHETGMAIQRDRRLVGRIDLEQQASDTMA
jgi:hypothetical protein